MLLKYIKPRVLFRLLYCVQQSVLCSIFVLWRLHQHFGSKWHAGKVLPNAIKCSLIFLALFALFDGKSCHNILPYAFHMKTKFSESNFEVQSINYLLLIWLLRPFEVTVLNANVAVIWNIFSIVILFYVSFSIRVNVMPLKSNIQFLAPINPVDVVFIRDFLFQFGTERISVIIYNF